MKLTERNTRYDADSGAFIVQQPEEIRLLRQVMERLERLEAKTDALLERGA